MKRIEKKELNRQNAGAIQKLPIKVVQFGEGNFLRAFVDFIIDKLNTEAGFNAGVAVVQPIPEGLVDQLNEQDGLYNLFLKGLRDGEEVEEKRMVSCIQKGIKPYENYAEYLDLAKEGELGFLVSNTTEAGIVFNPNDALKKHPHQSFPAKVTALLYERYKYFKGAADKGLTIIPCELINNNGTSLKEIVLQYAQLWSLEEDFVKWINDHNSFHNTLVDRIVPGYPWEDIAGYQDQLEFEDKLIVTAEVFLLWVIEGDEKLKQEIPFDKIEENVLVVEDMQPYRTRKVRILNGAHTVMVPFSLMYGNETVKETLDNDFTGSFIKKTVNDEISRTIDLPEKELKAFASDVFERFKNPFIKHQLASIALNSISKFKVRVLPSLLAYEQQYHKLPLQLTFAFACLIRFYKGDWNGRLLPVKDDESVVEYFKEIWKSDDKDQISEKVLRNADLWGEDLTKIPELKEQISFALTAIDTKGIVEGFEDFRNKIEVSEGK